MFDRIKKKYVEYAQHRINQNNRKRLKNHRPVIIANDCTGGFLYKYLGLPYTTPFMWMSIPSESFITILENLDDFLNTPIKEDNEKTRENGYPTARGWGNTILLFPHAKTFEAAEKKWEERKKRLDSFLEENGRFHYPTDHIGFMITEGFTDRSILERFAALPYSHKIAFITDPENADIPCTFLIRNWKKETGLWSVKNRWTGARFIDDFDYVSFMNDLQ